MQRIAGIWNGTIEGHPEIDERGLTEAIARRKAEEAARGLDSRLPGGPRDASKSK